MSIEDKERPVITSFPVFILIFWPGDRAERMWIWTQMVPTQQRETASEPEDGLSVQLAEPSNATIKRRAEGSQRGRARRDWERLKSKDADIIISAYKTKTYINYGISSDGESFPWFCINAPVGSNTLNWGE